jgi:inner membrane protein
MHMVWWAWVSLGLVLLLSEVLTPGGFYLLFIGAAAVVVGAFEPLIHTLWIEIVLFAVLSVALIAGLRKPMVKRLRKVTPQADTPEFIGETARTGGTIAAGKEGSIEMRGTTWKARNAGDTDLPDKAACVIVAREGLLLVVKPQ